MKNTQDNKRNPLSFREWRQAYRNKTVKNHEKELVKKSPTKKYNEFKKKNLIEKINSVMRHPMFIGGMFTFLVLLAIFLNAENFI